MINHGCTRGVDFSYMGNMTNMLLKRVTDHKNAEKRHNSPGVNKNDAKSNIFTKHMLKRYSDSSKKIQYLQCILNSKW